MAKEVWGEVTTDDVADIVLYIRENIAKKSTQDFARELGSSKKIVELYEQKKVDVDISFLENISKKYNLETQIKFKTKDNGTTNY